MLWLIFIGFGLVLFSIIPLTLSWIAERLYKKLSGR